MTHFVMFYIQEAIELVSLAVENDKNKNYEEAIKYYTSGIEQFMYAIQSNFLFKLINV